MEYGKRGEYERSATRFCTIGGVPPWTVPYAREGLLWGPPIAGVCVPSSCTVDGLYMLFDDEEIGFADFLLNEASKDGFGDNDDINCDIRERMVISIVTLQGDIYMYNIYSEFKHVQFH